MNMYVTSVQGRSSAYAGTSIMAFMSPGAARLSTYSPTFARMRRIVQLFIIQYTVRTCELFRTS